MDNLDGSHPGLEEIARQIQDLNRRVGLLEHRFSEPEAPPRPEVMVEPAASPSLEEETTRLVPVLGKALLAVAGAYFLRALAETRVLPLKICVIAGIVYALLWLILAARAGSRFVTAVHGLTSVMVLSPLLWEAAIRFHAIPNPLAAGVLWAFCVFGLAISWKKNVAIVAWITTLAGLMTASALLAATRDLVPFTYGLLAMAAAVEFSACREHWLRERWVVAPFADAAVLLMTFVVSRPGGVPESYAPVSVAAALGAQAALLVIYLASIIVRTMIRGITFTAFETAQCVLAFLLCLGGAVNIAHRHPIAFIAVSVFCLLCGAACYIVSFVFLEGHGLRNRNFYIYSAFGLLLIAGGSRLLLDSSTATLLWVALGLGCLEAGGRYRRTTLHAHGGIYLALAAFASGWALWPWGVLLESARGIGELSLAAWTALAAGPVAYLLLLRHPRAGDSAVDRLLAFGLAAYAFWSIAGVGGGLYHTLCHATGEDGLAAALCPTAMTAILTLLSLALAWCWRRWRRRELAWLVFPMMALAAYKLLFVDFRGSHMLALFASLLFFGASLILLPRTMHRGSVRG